MASKQKTKGTLLSWTLKVEENKVPLVFQFEAVLKSYGRFIDSGVETPDMETWSQEIQNGHNFLKQP